MSVILRADRALEANITPLGRPIGMAAPDRFDLAGDEVGDLLRGAADEAAWVEQGPDVDRPEGRVSLKPLDQVVPPALVQPSLGGEGMSSDALVQLLTVPPGADGRHQQVLGRQEWQLLVHVPGNRPRMHDQAG